MHFLKVVVYFAFSVCCFQASAQLCSGSLGDPLVNITFGSGTNPGPALPAGTTNYQYQQGDCPGDGFYTIRNSTSSCFSNTWHTLTADHTGNANGYFMLINASVQPSAFYIDTINLFCTNTTYEFSAWVINMLRPSSCGGNGIKPNLTFSIEQVNGTVIQTFNSGNIDHLNTPVWNKYGFFFTNPVNVSKVVLKIVNNSTGGCGNDLALDDISFRPCGQKITSNVIGGGVSANICSGKDTSIAFTAIAPGFSDPFYQWQQSIDGGANWTDIPMANTLTFLKSFQGSISPGNYLYRLAVSEKANAGFAQCRVYGNAITVIINPKPVTSATNSGPVCSGSNLQLSASGGINYSWSGPNGFSAAGKDIVISNVQISQAGKYFVTVVNSAGCSAVDSTVVLINPKPVAATTASVIELCKGKSVQLSVSGGTSYNWFPATGLSSVTVSNPTASPFDTIQYFVEVKNTFGCADTTNLKVNVVPLPAANAGADTSIISGQSIVLNGIVAGSDSFYWSPSLFINNTQLLNPTVFPVADTRYVLHVISKQGCGEVRDTVFVKVIQNLVIPNAFSPNGDGINDTWKIPVLTSYPNHEVLIFDRYGRELFRSKSFIFWDGKYNGKSLPVANYYFIINLNNGNPPISGSVLIVK